MLKKLYIILYVILLIVSASFVLAGDSLDNGLVHYYNFEQDDIATNLTDQVGTLDSDNVEAVTSRTATGISGYAWDFEFDADDWVNFPSVGNLPVGNANRSFSFWVKQENIGIDTNAWGYGTYAAATYWVVGYISTDNQIYMRDNNIHYGDVYSSPSAWVHIAMIYNGNNDTLIMYANGTGVGSFVVTLNTGTTEFTIGQRREDDLQPWDGLIDEWAAWDRVLNQSEITELYNGGTGTFYPFILPDLTPPVITVLSPNSTYNETYNANIWINFTTDESANCTINNSAFKVFSDTGIDFRYNESTLIDSFYTVNISCDDASDNINSTLVYFTKDTTIPVITSVSPSETNLSVYENTGLLNITFTLTDNIDLFVYNLTISELVSGLQKYNNSLGLSGTSYLFTQLVNTSSWNNLSYKQIVRVCDSHTASLIKPATGIIEQKDTLRFQFGDITINIKSINGNELSTNAVKQKDRYTFAFNYDKNETSSKVYELTSSHKITYLPDSKYKGHFVISDVLWIDFSNDGDVTVEKTDEGYLIYVDNPKKSVLFNSIGYLNCVTEHYEFELTERAAANKYDIGMIASANWFNTDILDTSTTAGVFLYFFIFLILIALVILGEHTQIPAIVILTGLMGFFIGILFFVIISAIIGVVVTFISTFYIIRSIEFLK